MNERIAQKEILNFSTIQRNDMFANFETMQMNLYECNNCTEIHLNHVKQHVILSCPCILVFTLFRDDLKKNPGKISDIVQKGGRGVESISLFLTD